jgi:Tol biopolymer transport system component
MSRAALQLRLGPAPRLLAGLAPLLAAFALAATPARADFAQATLVSGASQVQFDEANAPALSADGRYAVFQGSLASVHGVYRRDQQTGAVELVAGAFAQLPAASAAEKALNAPDAAAPSVSADGRYAVFTTTADLEPLTEGKGEPPADQGCPEVYVRDMQLKPGEPGAYTLASALNGSEEGIVFETKGYVACAAAHGFAAAGAQAAPSVALSADGRQVAFTVLSESNLAGANTPPGQVAVRNLDTKATTLVTATPGGQPAPGGGAFPSIYALKETLTQRSVAIGLQGGVSQPRFGDQAAGSTAAISADGSTVAWLGMNLWAQVPAAEAQREPQLTEEASGNGEAELLWRRVADGPGAETRRLLAGAGLGFFFNNPSPRPNPVEAGSFLGTVNPVFIAPALSADGRTVAAVASAPSAAAQPGLVEIAKANGIGTYNTDAYAIHVDDNPASTPAVTALTEITSYAAQPPMIEDVKDVAISSDGTRVAFDTARTQPYLPSLAFVSLPSAFTQKAETYEANLQRGTLQRVTSTYGGAEPNGEAGLLAFSGDGQTLAFASLATNLFYGDGVGAWEVYATHELPSSTQVTPQQIGAPPPAEAPVSEWLLSATASAAPDGSVLVEAQVPGAGKLGVRATAQLPASSGRPARSSRRHLARGGARRGRAAKRRQGTRRQGTGSRAGGPIPAHTVARGATTSDGPSELRVRLRVDPAYGGLVASRGGLYAVLRVTFTAPGHGALVQEIPVTFHRAARGMRAHKARSRATRRATKSGKRGTGR